MLSGRLQLPGLPFAIDVLPVGSRVIVESATVRYRTAHHSDNLVADALVRNDLTGTDDVRIETPLNRRELRNPREEDREHARSLLDHLDENIERYHHVPWARMSPDRRFMLLDGVEAPNSGGRSVAGVVDNEMVGIVGNSLVLPVSPGLHLDPTFSQDAENPVNLLEHYEPNTPVDPSRTAIPTRGVYAEAVMGACNSCEVKEEERFWRWEESPIPDSPPTILPVSTDSRRADPPDLTVKDLPAPLIALQNAPAAPDPTGLAAVLGLLGQSGICKDATGLEGTQAQRGCCPGGRVHHRDDVRHQGRRPRVLDPGGVRIASQKLRLSVPQYVRVDEDAAFTTALTTLNLAAHKNRIVDEAKATLEQVLARSNVRVYWNAGSHTEAVPAFVPATSLMVVTLRDTSPASATRLGQTNPPGGPNRFDETIDIFVGAFDTPSSIDVDTETQALLLQLQSTLAGGSPGPALEAVAATVYGRLIGETTSHEIVHGLLWTLVDPSFHNNPPIPGDLMNEGGARMFRQRTGMENTVQVSPVEPGHFVDHGRSAIGVLQATNQALVDSLFPTVP